MNQIDFTDLLAAYRSIWNNRLLEAEQRNPEEILKEAITRELLDEYSHPRIRKNKFQKFYLAIRRINQSPLSSQEQMNLITLHIDIFEHLNEA